MDTIQELRGRLKSMEVKTTYYLDNKTSTSSSIIYFNKNNKRIRQVDIADKFTDETLFNYSKNGLLESSITRSADSSFIAKNEYKYDLNENLISYHSFDNNILSFYKTTKYDNKNNKIEEKYFKSDNQLDNIATFEHDYKNKNFTTKRTNSKNILNDFYYKFFYDSRGYLILTETYKNNSLSSKSRSEYDDRGNLVKRISYNQKGDIHEAIVYKNKYDKKGNIIIREAYIQDKLFQQSTININYR